jgi:caa(3)-type oxidase subunit IV
MTMATTTRAAHGGTGRVAHELKRPYVPVFGFLALVTVVEVQIPSLGATLGIPGALQVLFLLGTAVIKAAMVALYYMHLRYEPRILKLIPLGPLAFVVLLLLVVMLH